MGKERKKISFLHSIAMKVVLSIIFAVCVTWLLEVMLIMPLARENVSGITENYMYDMTVVYGDMLDQRVAQDGRAQALASGTLSTMFQNVKIQSAESSYVYITDGEGTMLYHPTADKIGQPVENEVVQGVVSEIAQGNIPQPHVITYDFHGTIKYAAYYVGGNGNFVLVMTADESEVFSTVSIMEQRAYFSGVVVLVVCSILGYILASLVVKPIKQMADNVLRLSELDFTENALQVKLNKRKDETGQVSHAVSVLQEQLVRVVGQIRDQSTRLYDAAEYLSSSGIETSDAVGQVERAVGEIADGASSQAEETQKATENVILIGNMVEEVSRQVEMLRDNADRMRQAGDEAIDTLNQLDDTNSQTREAIGRIYEQTHTTNVSAMKIREAAFMITSIAEETNLLSLNASIEAARAGEQGRGFAVVASQIQKLAEQSNESATQIGQIIESLIHDSEEAVATMDGVKEIIAKQNANVEKTGAGFAEVKSGIDSSVDSVNAITEKIGKLDEARINVVDVVQNLTAIAEENAAGTQETSASVTEVTATIQNMADQAEKLKEVASAMDKSMDVFKI